MQLRAFIFGIVILISVAISDRGWGADSRSANSSSEEVSSKAASSVAVSEAGQLPLQRRVRDDIQRLQASERFDPEVLKRLRRAPRALVLEILRDDLKGAVKVSPPTLKAVVALEAHELTAELKALVAISEDWNVFAAVNSLMAAPVSASAGASPGGSGDGPKLFGPLYLERLPNLLAPPAKIAVLDGLAQFEIPLNATAFDSVITSPSYDVRIAAVEQFIATRGKLSAPERLARMKRVLALRPRQARELAMRDLVRQPSSELKDLATVLTPERCASEAHRQTREACAAAAKTVMAAGDAGAGAGGGSATGRSGR